VDVRSFAQCHLFGQTRERNVFSVQCRPNMLALWLGIFFELLLRLIFFEETGNHFSWSAWCSFDRVNSGDDGLFFVSMLFVLCLVAPAPQPLHLPPAPLVCLCHPPESPESRLHFPGRVVTFEHNMLQHSRHLLRHSVVTPRR